MSEARPGTTPGRAFLRSTNLGGYTVFVRLYAPEGGASDGSAAPAAGAPAAGAGGSAAAGNAAPAATTGTDAAIAAARARIAEGKPIVEPPAGDAAGATDTAGAASEDVATDGDGSADAGAEGADGAAGAGEQEFTVSLPGLDDRGEEAMEVVVGDKETFDRLNRMKNGYMSGQQAKAVREEAQQLRGQVDEIEDMIAVDPTGFVLQHVPQEIRADIAMQLLFEPEVLKQVRDTVMEALENGDTLKVTQAQLKASRYELKDKLQRHSGERKAMNANAREVAAEINRLIPENVTGSKREMLFKDAIRDVTDRAQRLGLKMIDPQDAVLIVAARFREHGIDLRATAGTGTRTAAASAPGKPAAGAAPAARTGQDFRTASATRRNAAAAAPAGAGAPASAARPELPASQKDGKDTNRLIDRMRTQGIRAVLGKK